MKKLLLNLTLICFLALSAGSLSMAFAQYDYESETAPDTLSIDDADPVLLLDEEESDEKKCCTGLYIGIAVIVVVVGGILVYRSVNKKKKE